MKSALYDKILELLKSGIEITASYIPDQEGVCDFNLTFNSNDNNLFDYLFEELDSWWEEDLRDNYLIANDIFGSVEVKFILDNNKIKILAKVQMSGDSYDEHLLYNYFDNEVIEFLKKSFVDKIVDKNHLLFTFENDSKKIENLEIVYLGENLDDYELLEFTKQDFNIFELIINKIVNSFKYYSKDIKGISEANVWVSCTENRITITEDWLCDFDLKREER